MINYFNAKKYGDKYLVTNDMGYYAFLNLDEYNKLCNDEIDNLDDVYDELTEKGFIIKNSLEDFIRENTILLREMKSYCLSGTSLHIFAVTNMCNLDCIYCQAHSRKSELNGKMSLETGKRAIDIAMSSKSKNLTFEFQGGEPLLNFDVVKGMIEYAKEKNAVLNKNIQFTIVTNLTCITDNAIDYLLNNGVSICTSLDGNEVVHNHNRPYKSNGLGSYDVVVDKIRLLKERGADVGAIQTTSKESLKYPEEIIDQYVELGINHIFLRPLTPLGMADSSWNSVGYTVEEYVEFYKKAFRHIIDINKKGITFVETHASYFLNKILNNFSYNYMELRSPCGAVLGQMSYYYDGNIYTCDEGRMMHEMGDDSFLLGNVYRHSYKDLVESDICKTLCKASIIESLPKCHNCVYQPYCGTCPVVNYAYDNDLYSRNPKDYRCKSYSTIMELIFDIIKLGDKKEMDILYSWID